MRMEAELLKLGLAGVVILALGGLSWKLIAMLLDVHQQFIDALKTTLQANTAAMQAIAPRLDRIEQNFAGLPCQNLARPDMRGIPGPPSSTAPAWKAAPNQNPILSGGE